MKAGEIFTTGTNSEGSVLQLDGANSFKGNITTTGSVSGGTTKGHVRLNVNANQESMGLVSIDKGDLNLYIDGAVTRVAFADHSGAANWGTGKFKVSEGFGSHLPGPSSAHVGPLATIVPAGNKNISI